MLFTWIKSLDVLSHAAGTRKGGEHHQATFVAPDPQHPMYMDDLGSIG